MWCSRVSRSFFTLAIHSMPVGSSLPDRLDHRFRFFDFCVVMLLPFLQRLVFAAHPCFSSRAGRMTLFVALRCPDHDDATEDDLVRGRYAAFPSGFSRGSTSVA